MNYSVDTLFIFLSRQGTHLVQTLLFLGVLCYIKNMKSKNEKIEELEKRLLKLEDCL